MNIKINKATVGVLSAVVLAVAAYWHWSPYISIHRMQAAAKAQDPDAFNDYVDYPKLRASLKSQLTTLMTGRLAESKAPENPFAALGAMLAMSMVGSLVDAMVRPEAVMHAMQNGKLSQPGKQPSEAPSVPTGSASQTGSSAESSGETKWDYERKGANKLIAYAIDPRNPSAVAKDGLGIVFQRSGFADWKLTEVRISSVK